MTVFPTMQVYLPSIGLLLFGYLFFLLRRDGKIGQSGFWKALLVLTILFILSLFNARNGYQAMRDLVELQPEQVRSINFFDEGANHYLYAHEPEIHPECLELAIGDRDRIASLVKALPHLTPYAPNHEGAKSRYLVRIDRVDGTALRFILGKGTRYASDVAWIELNSNARDGWHYGVYLNAPLYRELIATPTLAKWR